MSEPILMDGASVSVQPEFARHTRQNLMAHDAARLTHFLKLIGEPGRVSLEGEPIYADRAWDQFHAFTYDVVIPEVTDGVTDTEQTLDVLYDDCTVPNTPFSLNYYLKHIANSAAYQLPARTSNESDMLERASEWVFRLKSNGRTRRVAGVERLHDNSRPAALTTQSGRPTCAVLDAVYQMQKAESGVETAILVHSTGFRGQQLDMQAVLRSVNGTMPFENFANIYVRERKGAIRLAAIQVLNASAELTEVQS